MESTCDMGNDARSSVYVSEESRGGSRDVKDESALAGNDDDKGYSKPNSEKNQSGMSVAKTPAGEMTGLRITAAEKKSGY